ncbi:hypothetical protein PMZ80_007605, partial [Knufia obscura]
LYQLMRVSKAFHEIIEPRIWTDIELHRSPWHEYYQYETEYDYEAILRRNKARNYFATTNDKCGTMHTSYSPRHQRSYFRRRDPYFELKAMKLLKTFDEGAILYANERCARLAERIQSLCMTLSVDSYYGPPSQILNQCWSIISRFKNLESLELIAGWPNHRGEVREGWTRNSMSFSPRGDCAPLTKIRKLHLRGYIPQDFARFVCQSAACINDLELALLDRPVCSKGMLDPITDVWKGSPRENNAELLKGVSETEQENFDDYWEAFLRPLAALHETDIPEQFSSLRSLTLRRPAEARGRGDPRPGCYVSVPSDKRILSEWARLIRASRSTVEHLVLEQRPMADDREPAGTDNADFMALYAYGPGFSRFVEYVLPTLLEDADWPALKSIRLYGFDPLGYVRKVCERVDPDETLDDDYGDGPPYDYTEHDQERARLISEHCLLPMLQERFKPLGVNVDSVLGRRMLFDPFTGIVQWGDGFGATHPKEED